MGGSSASSHSPAPPNTTPPGEGQFGEQEAGCAKEGRMRQEAAGFPSPLLLGAPLAASRTQMQKHPHLPAAVVLLGGLLAQLARLLADGRQGLVTGTVIPATFLGTQDERESQPSSRKPPKPFTNQVSRPELASACCVILSKRLDLSVSQAITRGKQEW